MTLLLQNPSFDLWWEPQEGVVRLQSPGRVFAGAPGVEFVRQGHLATLTTDRLSPGRIAREALQDAHGTAEEVQVYCQEALGLTLCLRMRFYATRPFALFRLTATNVGPDTVALQRFFIRTLPEGIHTLSAPTGFYANGWQSWSPAGFLPAEARGFALPWPLSWLQGPMIQNAETPCSGKAGRFWSESVGAIVTSKEALIMGGASLAEQFVQVYADLRPAHLTAWMQSQVDGVLLAPGEARSSEWFYVEWVALPSADPFAQYAAAVARQMNLPPFKPAPTGWCSWYIYWNKVREADVMENLASAALLVDELPLKVIQLDEGYQAIWGDWFERNARFPRRLRWLSDRIRGSGFTAGLWLGPLTAHPKSRLVTAHPDWVLRDHRGHPVSPGLISGAFMRALDPTHPGVEEHLQALIHWAVQEEGFEYLKLDFMYAGALVGQRHNPQLTRAQALRNAFQIIREAAGESTYLVGCGAPLGPAIGLVDAMRIGPDTAPAWPPMYGRVGWLLRNNPSLPSLRNSLSDVATRGWMHNRWWINDPDTLMVRATETELTDDEALAQVTLLGLSGGLLVLSDDLDGLPPARRAWVAALTPSLVEGMDVLDLLAQRMPEAVTAPVARPWGHWRLLGLFNWSAAPVERVLPEDLHLNRQKAYHIVDFWERRYFHLDTEAALPVLHLPPHGAVLLGVRPVESPPQLVATTFHITQGAELTAWNVEPNAVILTLSLDRVARGEVWLALPTRPTSATLNGAALPMEAIRTVAPGIWAVACRVKHTADLQVMW
ncbi:MAG TPA: alpha-galactosidase [Anaerolineae bacterium]|nr:alpha-galactosidase [Anaerolineae bacterium]